MENVWSLFFNWMAENPIRATVIISAVVIALCILLGFVLPARSARWKREKEQRWRDARTVKTLGFIRSAKHTGRSVNDNPEFRFVVDALAEDGTFFETTVTEIIPRAQLPMCAAGAPLSIRYDPADRSCINGIGINETLMSSCIELRGFIKNPLENLHHTHPSGTSNGISSSIHFVVPS